MEPNLGLPDDLSLPEPWQRTLSLPGDPALPGLETLREYGLAETLPELDLGDLAVELGRGIYAEVRGGSSRAGPRARRSRTRITPAAGTPKPTRIRNWA